MYLINNSGVVQYHYMNIKQTIHTENDEEKPSLY